MKRKLTILIIIVLIIAIIITGIFIMLPRQQRLKEGVVATVNGTEILEEEYNKLLNYYLSALRDKHNLADDELNKDIGTGMTLLDSLKSDVLDTIILSKIIAEEAEANNIKVDEAEFQKLYKENHLKLMEEDEDYRKIIEENEIDEDFVKDQIRKDLLGYQYKIFYLDKIEITDEIAKTFYEENIQIYNMDRVKVKHIVVDEEQLAKDIIKKLEAGEDFEELAKEYSKEPAAQQTGGELDYFSRDANMAPEFKEAAFSLEIGKISEPVKTEFGYHVIIVEDKIEETVEFEDAKEGIKYSLKESGYQNHIGEIFEKADIVKKNEL